MDLVQKIHSFGVAVRLAPRNRGRLWTRALQDGIRRSATSFDTHPGFVTNGCVYIECPPRA